MFGFDPVRLHAALNDLPTALLVAAVLFDLGAWLLKRESLAWAGLWALWAGVVGGWAAVFLGNLAEDAIDHGDAMHEVMERHESLALIVMSVFTAILLWKLWRRTERTGLEEWVLRALSVAGVGGLIVVARLGGDLVFKHAAGIPSDRMIEELKDRGALPAAGDSLREPSGSHTHEPGTAPHAH